MGPLVSHLAFTRALLATNLKAALGQRAAFAMQVAFMMLNNATFFIFWGALLHQVPHLRGWQLADMQLLFGIVAAGFGLGVILAGGVMHLGRFIDEGELDTLLTQPRPVLPYALALRLQPSGVGDLGSGVIFIAWSGHVTWAGVPLVLAAVVASALVIVASGVVFFSLAFWLGRVDTLARQLWELLITFSLYPEPLFGGVLRLVLFSVLPAGFAGYVPVHLVREPTAGRALILTAAAGLYVALACFVFERRLKRYASGSRFASFG